MATTRDSGTSLGASVGLTDDDLREMYRYVALARALDERMWILNRAGRIPFVISGQGHEGAQVGIAWAFQRGHDWIAPFYRSIATCLTFGMSPRDILTAQYATANDPSSGGRQMPGHYGSHEHNLVSVVVAGRDPAAARGGHRPGRQDPQERPGRHDVDGRGEQQPGRRPRGPQLRGHPPAAVRLRGREQRLRHQRAAGPSGRRLQRGRPGRRVRHPGRHRRRHRRAGLLRGGTRGGGAGAGRRRPDPHRGQGHASDRALVGRPADQVPLARRSWRPRRALDPLARCSAPSCAMPAS